MTPAEKRIKELLDRWLTSIELHLQYVELSDDAYWKVQTWPKHDRPTRWVLESAKQKANELKDVFESRHGMGDSKFADALELMSFLANLVGAQHVDRFVPLAEPRAVSAMSKSMTGSTAGATTTGQMQTSHARAIPPSQDSTTSSPVRPAAAAPTSPPKRPAAAPPTSDVPSWYMQAQAGQSHFRPQPAAQPISKPADPPAMREPPRNPRVHDTEATREMPEAIRVEPNKVDTRKNESAVRQANDSDATREIPKFRNSPAPVAAPAKADPPRKSAAQKPAGTAKQNNASKAPAVPNEMHQTVINDAVRLLGWGRTWHELAELIARMADRPALGEIRKILRTHRATIEKTAKT